MPTRRKATKFDRRLGTAIRARRIERGMSMAKLGAAIGVSFQQVQKFERGTNRLSAEAVVSAGFAADHAAVEASAREVEGLAGDDRPGRRQRAWRLGVGADVLEAGQRRREIGNFLASLSTARGVEWRERDRVAR